MKQNLPFLKHILDETKFLLNETGGFTYEDFIAKELLKRGCIRSLEVIGEAVKNFSTDFKKKYKDIQWKKIAGMRDKIIGYQLKPGQYNLIVSILRLSIIKADAHNGWKGLIPYIYWVSRLTSVAKLSIIILE